MFAGVIERDVREHLEDGFFAFFCGNPCGIVLFAQVGILHDGDFFKTLDRQGHGLGGNRFGRLDHFEVNDQRYVEHIGQFDAGGGQLLLDAFKQFEVFE